MIAYRKRSGSSIPIQKSLPKNLAAGDDKPTDISTRPETETEHAERHDEEAKTKALQERIAQSGHTHKTTGLLSCDSKPVVFTYIRKKSLVGADSRFVQTPDFVAPYRIADGPRLITTV